MLIKGEIEAGGSWSCLYKCQEDEFSILFFSAHFRCSKKKKKAQGQPVMGKIRWSKNETDPTRSSSAATIENLENPRPVAFPQSSPAQTAHSQFATPPGGQNCKFWIELKTNAAKPAQQQAFSLFQCFQKWRFIATVAIFKVKWRSVFFEWRFF